MAKACLRMEAGLSSEWASSQSREPGWEPGWNEMLV